MVCLIIYCIFLYLCFRYPVVKEVQPCLFLVGEQTSNFDPASVSSLSVDLINLNILEAGASLELPPIFLNLEFYYFLIIYAFLSYGHLNNWKSL